MKLGKFSSHQIVKNKAKELVAQKLLNNINFTSNIDKKRGNTLKESSNDFEKQIEFFNASDIMRNFFTGGKPSKSIRQSSNNIKTELNTRNIRNTRNNIFNSFNSNKIAREVSSEKGISGVEYMINRSIDCNRIDKKNSSVLGQSILDLSLSRSRFGYSRERKKTESPLRYEDYVNRKSNMFHSHANSTNLPEMNKPRSSIGVATDVFFVDRRSDMTKSKESMNEECSGLAGRGKNTPNVRIAKLKAKTKISKTENVAESNKEKGSTQKKRISSFHPKTISGKKTAEAQPSEVFKTKIDTKKKKKTEVKSSGGKKILSDKIGEAIQSTLPPIESAPPVKISITQPPEAMPCELVPKENVFINVHSSHVSTSNAQEEVLAPKNNNDTDNDVDINGDSDEADEGNIAINTVYKANPIFSINDIQVKNEIPANEEPLKQYNEIIQKFLFSGSSTLDENNSSCISNKSLNESRRGNFDKDIDSITSTKQRLKNIKKYYKHEIKRMETAIQKIEIAKVTELESIRAKKETEIKSLKEKIKTEDSVGDSSINNQNHMKKIQMELDTLKSNLALKENNYKNTIKTLLEHLQSASRKNLSVSSSMSGDEQNLNDSVMKEANDLLKSKEENIKGEMTVENKNVGEDYDEDSMLLELKEFKEDDSENYKFEIPLKYHISAQLKVENEETRNGKLVKFYENSVVEIMHKNKNLTRLFPDGYSITFYKNKDIKQTFPNGTTVLLYFKNKSIEFCIPSGGFIAYKFKNGQFEKHYFDGRKYIKFSDGTIKIIRPNGEELNQFIDFSVQRKDKSGLITIKNKVEM